MEREVFNSVDLHAINSVASLCPYCFDCGVVQVNTKSHFARSCIQTSHSHLYGDSRGQTEFVISFQSVPFELRS